MLKRFFLLSLIVITSVGGCGSDDSNISNIPPELNLLTSECPGEDINEVPITEGYAWECTVIETGEVYIAGTLSGLSQAGCFSTVHRTDAYCDIEVLGKARFTAQHHEFDLENPPPPDELRCDPEIAIAIEEVECRTVFIN